MRLHDELAAVADGFTEHRSRFARGAPVPMTSEPSSSGIMRTKRLPRPSRAIRWACELG